MFKTLSRTYVTAFLLSTTLPSLASTSFLDAKQKDKRKSSKLDKPKSKSKKKQENKVGTITSKSKNENTNNLTNTLHQTITLTTPPGYHTTWRHYPWSSCLCLYHCFDRRRRSY